MEQYSVLMSVYNKDNPSHLRSAIDSMLQQSVPCHDFVIVCDGPLTEALDEVISEYSESSIPLDSTNTDETLPHIEVIRLDKNGGLGPALNEGMRHCQCDLIARMDADDIALSDRCEKQLAEFDKHPDLSLCSGYVTEFDVDPLVPGPVRKVPESSADINEFAKARNPFNHPCMMYRKSAVEQAGGYQGTYPYFEDYDLWLRMLWDGCTGYNLQENLLMMRAGAGMYKRRSGSTHIKSMKKLFKEMFHRGFITKRQYYKSVITRTIGDLIPNWARKMVYKKNLRG